MNNISHIKVLYIAGTFDYGDSVSGNYILYKMLVKCGVDLKVLPRFKHTKHNINSNNFLPYKSNYQLEELPKHDFLIISGNDFDDSSLKQICNYFNSKLVCFAMTHWMYGNNDSYPELTESWEGQNMNSRLELFNTVKSIMVTASSYSSYIHKQSPLSHIPFYQIPFPFDEIEICNPPSIKKDNKKYILWGTTQPETPRKGKNVLEHVLEGLYKKIIDHKDPNEIIVQTVGPKLKINTRFNQQNLGLIPDRLKLSQIYQNADVFLLTTLADAGPMMATECIKNSTPLISFYSNISTDMVKEGKNGYIVNSIEEWVDKLYQILYDKNFNMDLEYVKNFNSEKIVNNKLKDFFIKEYNSI